MSCNCNVGFYSSPFGDESCSRCGYVLTQEEEYDQKKLEKGVPIRGITSTEKIRDLELELASTKKMLDEALEIARYYADKDTYAPFGNHNDCNRVTLDDCDKVPVDRSCFYLAGKRARDFLAKHEKKEGANG